MTTPEHIAGLERRITDMVQKEQGFLLDAFRVAGTGPKAEQDRKTLRHSAASCRLDADKCRAKIAALREQEAA